MWRDKQAWMFSLKAYLAGISALYIGLATNLPRPYWAMVTVYIVSQPMLGPTLVKGTYRVLGTVAACCAVVALLPNLVQQPLLLSAAMSLWLGGCLFVALLLRGPKGYAFLLASYTVSFIGFPAVGDAEGVFITAVTRSEEIMLGTVMAALVAALVFPAPVRPMIRGRVDGWIEEARGSCARILRGEARQIGHGYKLAAGLSLFDAWIDFARREDAHHAEIGRWLQALRRRMLTLLPMLASLEDRLQALAASRAHGLPSTLRVLLARIEVWMRGVPVDDAEAQALRAALEELKPVEAQGPEDLVRHSLLLRLGELIDIWQDCRHLQHALATGAPPALVYAVGAADYVHTPHRDYSMAAFAGGSAALTLFLYCSAWIGLGWVNGNMGAMLAAVMCAFFASLDDPARFMRRELIWSSLAGIGAGVYMFGILPWVSDFGALVLVLAPTFLLLGLLMSQPATLMIGMPLMVNIATLMSLQEHYSPSFERYLNSLLSVLTGIGFAAVVTLMFRSVGAEWSARRLVRAGWRTLAEAAEGSGVQDREGFAARMLDLLALLAPRLAATPAGSAIATVDMLNEVRIGLDILQIRRARHDVPLLPRAVLDGVLADLAAHYRAQIAARRPLAAPPRLQRRLDAALVGFGEMETGAARDAALLGLVGVHRGLFREAVMEASS